ncbi:MAG TPA: hypothetical protein VFN63_00530 [Pseudolabrys sp.]|nr:hypothetical protein [Pseudolabrys sp.]
MDTAKCPLMTQSGHSVSIFALENQNARLRRAQIVASKEVRVKNGTEMTLTTIRLQLSLLPGRINLPILLSSKDGLCLRPMSLVQATKDLADPGERTCEIRIQRGKGAVRSVHHWSCRYLTMATSQALD